MLAESLIALVGFISLRAMPVGAAEMPAVNALPVARYAAPNVQPPLKRGTESLGVETTARSAAILDVKSGAFLVEKDANSAYPIASLTKLMTAMVLLDSKTNLQEEVTMDPADLPKEEGKSVFLPTERLTKRDLLRALLVGSVNSAGNAIARSWPEGEEAFIKAMNQKARTLGLRSAVYYDPTGLDARNQASARDVAIILRTALAYPEVRDITKLERVEIKGRSNNRTYVVKNTNLLLDSFLNKPPYRVIAAKTGSLPEAGYCLAQVTRNAEGNEIVAVVLGSDNHFARFQDAKVLTYWTFKNYEWPRSGMNAALAPLEEERP
ncbi:MAG: serine hydrolase [Patescibacteria group bacterium]